MFKLTLSIICQLFFCQILINFFQGEYQRMDENFRECLCWDEDLPRPFFSLFPSVLHFEGELPKTEGKNSRGLRGNLQSLCINMMNNYDTYAIID